MSFYQAKLTLALTLGITLAAPLAQAWENPTQGAVCAKEVDAKLTKLASKGEWIRQVDPAEKTTAYRTPTKKFGNWIELRRTAAGAVELRTIAAIGVEEFSWNKSCVEEHKQTITGKPMARVSGDKKFFFDSDLASLVKKNKEGIIYIWSPTLVYSMKYYSVFKEMADKLKLPMTVLLDPRWQQNAAKSMAAEYKMPFYDTRAEAIEFFMRDVGIHYPATLVYSGGKIARRVIFGIEEPKKLAMLVNQELATLRK